MSHIARVGRRSWRVRLGVAALYVVLLMGAVTTIYPFLLMVSTGMKSHVDYADIFAFPPPYLVDDAALFTKYAEDRYANNLDDLNAAHSTPYPKVPDARPPAGADTPSARRLAAEWDAFVATLPPVYKKAGFGEHDAAPSLLLLRYRAHLRDKFQNKINRLNELWTEENVAFGNVTPPFERTARREYVPEASPKMADWLTFKGRLPANFLVVQPADPLYQKFLREERYEDDLAKLNAAWGTNYAAWHHITLPATLAEQPDARRADWEQFIRTKYPLRLLVVKGEKARDAWREFEKKRERINTETAELPNPSLAADEPLHYETADPTKTTNPAAPLAPPQPTFPRPTDDEEAEAAEAKVSGSGADATAPPLAEPLPTGEILTDWMEFVKSEAPADALLADSAENRWRAALAARYGTTEAANQAFGTPWTTFGEAPSPQALADWRHVRANTSSLRWEFATRNFRAVADYVLLHGRAVFNTVVFCLLAILAAVTVNPLCAYALSRYNLPYAYKVLLFLLATMAFPAEVAMIPNFLLLRDLGLLNTFGALVLPTLASGFSIFLLKGFFDSLPKELYEAGILDGATEITMFRRITVPLSLPIFSVIALNAFTASYGAFLFALVVCQDPKMWTLMVWLYDLQSAAPPYLIMAALTLAALPTLIVFLFAQKVIMRGIILPSFK